MLLMILLLLCPLAMAQKIVAARAGMVYSAEGELRIDGKQYRSAGPSRLPQIEDGQTVASPRGHAEVLLGPNAVVWTGTRAQVRFDDTRVEQATVTIIEGAAIIELTRTLEEGRVQVHAGTLDMDLTREGVYRIDAAAHSVRVYSGEVLMPGAVRLQRGEEWAAGTVRTFDRRDLDEFQYWAAYRSFQLENDAGAYRRWGGSFGQREHSGFGVKFPDTPGAARAKYQIATQVGLVFFLEGSAVTGSQSRNSNTRLPLPLGRDNFLRTEAGKAEVMLGAGVVVRVAENTRLRIVDASALHPVAALDEGTALIEVADSAEVPSHIRLGDSDTALLKPGLYSFDAKTGLLRVFGGEAATTLGGRVIRSRESQQVNLRQAAPLARFNAKTRDALFRWSAERSYALYASSAAFMTQWEQMVQPGQVRHKQFGERRDPRSGRNRPPPRAPSIDLSKGPSGN